jgi:hypothetical protein
LEVVTGNAEHFLLHRHADSNRRLPGEPNPIIACACGCGDSFAKFDSGGRPRKFVSGHNPQPSAFIDDVFYYLLYVPEPSTSQYIASFFDVERRKVTSAVSKLKHQGKAVRKGQEWRAVVNA